MFMKKSTLNRLLKEERKKYASLGFEVGYKSCLAEYGGKGFITGLQQAECILRDKEI